MKKRMSLLMALVMIFTVSGVLSAAPQRLVKVRPVTSASSFKGRQTPKFQVSPIVIPPVDLAGGNNLAKAKASIEKAIADVELEIADQQKVIKGYKIRITSAQKNIAKYNGLLKTYTAQRDSIQEEITVLEGISNPSSAILACISELKSDLAAANNQITNVKKSIKEYEERLKFYQTVGVQANKNLTRLNTSLSHIQKAKASLGLVKVSVPKPSMTKPLRFR